MDDKQIGQPRAPMRKRGLERYEYLLDVAAELIGANLREDVTLAQIAEAANVPLASLYHFFPNRNAIMVALANRYHRELNDAVMMEGNLTPNSWQEVFEFRIRRTAAYLNAHPAALRLFNGAGVSVEVRSADVSGNALIAHRRAEYLRQYFNLDFIPDLERRIAVSLAIIDGVWALAFSNNYRLTEADVDEAVKAAIAYLRCYLPDYLAPRQNA